MLGLTALRHGGGLVLAGCLLAACAGTAPEPTTSAVETTAPSTQTVMRTAPPQVRQQAVPQGVPQAALPPQHDPAGIVGLEPSALVRLLGNPWLKRDERPAQVWLYASGACAFHVFLYADPNSGRYAVRYFDAVPRASVPVSRLDCFNALLRRQGPLPATGA